MCFLYLARAMWRARESRGMKMKVRVERRERARRGGALSHHSSHRRAAQRDTLSLGRTLERTHARTQTLSPYPPAHAGEREVERRYGRARPFNTFERQFSLSPIITMKGHPPPTASRKTAVKVLVGVNVVALIVFLAATRGGEQVCV